MISSLIKWLKARRRNSLFWKIKIIIIFNMIILGTWKCYYMVLLQQDFNTGLFRVLQHVMGKWFRTIHGQQVLATLFTFARYSWLAKLGYGYLAMISQLLSLANWWLGLARNWLRLRLKMAKSLSCGNTTDRQVNIENLSCDLPGTLHLQQPACHHQLRSPIVLDQNYTKM